MRIAFYPCCANDVEEPRCLLRGYADEIVFCGVNPKLLYLFRKVGRQDNLPVAKFVVGHVTKSFKLFGHACLVSLIQAIRKKIQVKAYLPLIRFYPTFLIKGCRKGHV